MKNLNAQKERQIEEYKEFHYQIHKILAERAKRFQKIEAHRHMEFQELIDTQAKKIEAAGGKFSSMNRLTFIAEFEAMERERNKP